MPVQDLQDVTPPARPARIPLTPLACPYCGQADSRYVVSQPSIQWTAKDRARVVGWVNCSICERPFVFLRENLNTSGSVAYYGIDFSKPLERLRLTNRGGRVIWPRKAYPDPPEEVPPHLADLFRQAAAVLEDSPMASAALSRRCLQQVLEEAGGVTAGNLDKQIDQVEAELPSDVARVLDEVREIGNFAAHPRKSQHTGEVMEVEPTEAAWNVEALALVFDHYFVKPSHAQQKRDRINQMLREAGRQELK
jgi:hypothetical protein